MESNGKKKKRKKVQLPTTNESSITQTELLCNRSTCVNRKSIIGKPLATSVSILHSHNMSLLNTVANVPPVSLYDVIEEKSKTLPFFTKKVLLHRMVLITDLAGTKRRRLGPQYEDLFRQIETRFQSDIITGMLLLYPKSCIHVIETSNRNLIETIKVFQRQANKGTVITNCKIVIIAKNIRMRLFPMWLYGLVSLEDENLEMYDVGEKPVQQISEMLSQLQQLGKFLHSMGKGVKEVIHKLSEYVPRFLPEQGLIYYLLTSNTHYVSTTTAFLKKFKQPYDVLLASETVWPHDSFSFPVTYRMDNEKQIVREPEVDVSVPSSATQPSLIPLITLSFHTNINNPVIITS